MPLPSSLMGLVGGRVKICRSKDRRELRNGHETKEHQTEDSGAILSPGRPTNVFVPSAVRRFLRPVLSLVSLSGLPPYWCTLGRPLSGKYVDEGRLPQTIRRAGRGAGEKVITPTCPELNWIIPLSICLVRCLLCFFTGLPFPVCL